MLKGVPHLFIMFHNICMFVKFVSCKSVYYHPYYFPSVRLDLEIKDFAHKLGGKFCSHLSSFGEGARSFCIYK